MIERLNKYRQQILAVLLAEVAIAFVCYMMLHDHAFLIFAIIIAVSNGVLGYAVFKNLAELEDLATHVREVVGKESNNAFLFGQVGILMYDENHHIYFQSELFNDRDVDLRGKALKDWQPILEEQFNDEGIIEIKDGIYRYEVYNNQDSKTLYLKDVTYFKDLLETYHTQQKVIGYLSIDNFDETIAGVDEQKGALIQSSVRSTLVEWANENGIILRRYRQEYYLLLADEEGYQKMAKGKFIVLNRIREKAAQYNVVLGVSIGLSRHETNIQKLDDAANEAFSLALSRGGDQVVVKSAIEPVRYFGGTSETKMKTSRVRVRIISQSLNGIFKHAENIFIMGHTESDLDSLGGSIALYHIAKKYKVPVHIVINPDSMEAKTKRAYRRLQKTDEYSDVFVLPSRVAELVREKSLLVCVDNHRPSLAIAPYLMEMVNDIIVIDHHRRGEEFVDSPILTYLEPAASSTVELITELFDYQEKKVKLSELEATILYAGMLVDTSNFKSRVGVRTFKVAATLKEMGADMAKATELLQDDLAFTLKKAEFIQGAKRYHSHVLIATGQEQDIHTRVMLAKVGNDLLAIDETDAAFVVGRIDENTVAVSGRSKDKVNVQVIMEKMGGGGHFGMAACQINNVSVEEVNQMLIQKIDEYYSEREEI